ncbi:MAG: UxaA family hydrolase [Synergistaceae bacterium]|nr:UxaA family hydrolase [Synergistaceae bacterium]MBR0080132.1 UxaA family hydrolase [Synergistaceae bacterium]MBR0233132.1 UxaA family hydrolase [Synergistaceae bacterium]MBR0251965.1 UxaA family hydrolase [Synergistaceae bacterium]
MKINALMIDEIDNVVTCVEEVSKGSDVFYRKGDEILSLKAEENIPYCHKIALKDFAKGDEVIKYGEMLGKTLEPISKGHWVYDKNIYSVPRDYDSEMIDLTGGKR